MVRLGTAIACLSLGKLRCQPQPEEARSPHQGPHRSRSARSLRRPPLKKALWEAPPVRMSVVEELSVESAAGARLLPEQEAAVALLPACHLPGRTADRLRPIRHTHPG